MINLKLQIENGKSIILLNGEIDTQGSNDLKKMLNNVLDNGSRQLIMDFSGVTFIGTSGINALLSFYIDFSAKGGTVNIINLDDKIGAMFKAIRLDKYFSF